MIDKEPERCLIEESESELFGCEDVGKRKTNLIKIDVGGRLANV